MKLRPKMLHSSSYARITQESRATNLRSHYAEVTQFLRRDYAVFTQQLRRFTQPLRNHYAKFTQSLRKVYAIQLRSITQFITQLLYAIALRNCFTQLFYAIVLRNCFTQLFYAFLRMSVNEKFTQKSCNLRKGQLADGIRVGTWNHVLGHDADSSTRASASCPLRKLHDFCVNFSFTLMRKNA